MLALLDGAKLGLDAAFHPDGYNVGIEDELGKLLEELGPSGSERTRHNPFWHLRTDGVWQLAGPAAITSRPAGATPTITELRRGHVEGGFAEPVRLAPTMLRYCDG